MFISRWSVNRIIECDYVMLVVSSDVFRDCVTAFPPRNCRGRQPFLGLGGCDENEQPSPVTND